MQANKYEHVFPLIKTCEFSPLEHQASGACDSSLPLFEVFSPFEGLSFDVNSLSPFDINSQEGIF